MKLAMILSVPLPPREGIGFYTWNLANQLTRSGHIIHLITRGKMSPLHRQEIDGITVWHVPFFPVYPFHAHFHNLFVQSLIRHLESDLDLLHLHTPLVCPPSTSLPMLVTVHTPLKADWRATRIKNLYGLIIRLQTPVSIGIEYHLFRRADKLVSVASSVAAEVAEYGVDPQDVTVTGNGVDIGHFYPSEKTEAHQDQYFLTVGRLGPRKGLEDLVEAASIIGKKYPNHKFYVIGEGPLSSILKKKVDSMGMNDRVIFLGHISDRDRLADYYRNSLAYIHPAHYEGLPTVLLEAMACGKAVIATAVSGALDVVRDGENGLLVPPREPEAIARAVFEILNKPDLASKLGIAAAQTIKASYSWEAIAGIYESQYKQLIDRGRSS